MTAIQQDPIEMIAVYLSQLEADRGIAEKKLKDLGKKLDGYDKIDHLAFDEVYFLKEVCEDTLKATNLLFRKMREVVVKIMPIREQVDQNPYFPLYLQHESFYENRFRPTLCLAESKFGNKIEGDFFLRKFYQTDLSILSAIIDLRSLS